ncbi:M23 family metallopeptidase [Jeotgalibacillus sp. R-1-5s-1]|uniref:M23 family metallopeptidase n=1 Tax=Jeotgalibacillus sp. R-1-5s-1 TaxID=2555897 RepID=UPI00106C45BE|nr:M23 family metallopeptidase [Jeotgalibacillus sp. R-1-5s-1]TFD95743.1 M23 family metallopeptidase [Jeotgalibacillus sp. R-1-5s-1]
MRKIAISTIMSLLIVSLLSAPGHAAEKPRVAVQWDRGLLVEGQIGRVYMDKNAVLFRLENNEMIKTNELRKAGDSFRIYSFKYIGKELFLGVGGGYFFHDTTATTYNTPSAVKKKQLKDRVVLKDALFPIAKNQYRPFTDSWGAPRSYGGSRPHEGTDILAKKGIPVYSATDGVIENRSWNRLGGWTYSIGYEGYSLYYAHLSKYEGNLTEGTIVKRGQLLGYIGDSGYGDEGTTGKFVNHLHFGIYDESNIAINPYPHLKYWETYND